MNFSQAATYSRIHTLSLPQHHKLSLFIAVQFIHNSSLISFACAINRSRLLIFNLSAVTFNPTKNSFQVPPVFDFTKWQRLWVAIRSAVSFLLSISIAPRVVVMRRCSSLCFGATDLSSQMLNCFDVTPAVESVSLGLSSTSHHIDDS